MLGNGSVVTAYQSNRTAAELIAAGRPTIAAYGNYYLADTGGADDDGWESRYTRADLCDEIKAEGACTPTGGGQLLMGGLASAWGETLSAANWDGVVWHSLLAVAERLWSPKLPKVVDSAARTSMTRERNDAGDASINNSNNETAVSENAEAESKMAAAGVSDARGRLEVMSCYLRMTYGVPVASGFEPGFCPADVRWPQ